MKHPEILIITNKNDFTTDVVVVELRQRKVPFLRLNTEDLFSKIYPTITFSGNESKVLLRAKNKITDLKSIKSIWFRRPELKSEFNQIDDKNVERFVRKERYEFLSSLYTALKDCFWISSPDAIRIAENKHLQIQKAYWLGLKVPKTMITSDPESARSFLKSLPDGCGITKTISGTDIRIEEEDCVIFTNEINADDIPSDGSLELSPCIFQEKVHKKSDIRVTVIGDKCTAVEITPTSVLNELIDWRISIPVDNSLRYQVHTLPKSIEEKCVGLVAEMGLSFSAIDLMLNDKDEYYFVDLNPNGQWAWLDTELPINLVGVMCDTLIEGY